jgi:hypothetical protein
LKKRTIDLEVEPVMNLNYTDILGSKNNIVENELKTCRSLVGKKTDPGWIVMTGMAITGASDLQALSTKETQIKNPTLKTPLPSPRKRSRHVKNKRRNYIVEFRKIEF